tara:strand:+ start:2971 stop:3438 length:468 start_codon:yes stop_codon:yes gene_type:complete
MEHYTETIIEDFAEYHRDNWSDYEGPFDEFRDDYIELTYNSDNLGPFNEQYRDLVYFMGIIHEESCAGDADWSDPQKIYELGMYLLAKETINDMEFEEDGVEFSAFTLNFENPVTGQPTVSLNFGNPVTEHPVVDIFLDGVMHGHDPQSNVEPSQ